MTGSQQKDSKSEEKLLGPHEPGGWRWTESELQASSVGPVQQLQPCHLLLTGPFMVHRPATTLPATEEGRGPQRDSAEDLGQEIRRSVCPPGDGLLPTGLPSLHPFLPGPQGCKAGCLGANSATISCQLGNPPSGSTKTHTLNRGLAPTSWLCLRNHRPDRAFQSGSQGHEGA